MDPASPPPPEALLESDALPREACALAAALALVALGRLAELEALYRAALGRGVDLERLREGALMAPLLAGFPRAIEGFAALEAAAGAASAGTPGTPPDGRSAAQRTAAGAALFARIYGTQAAAVRARLAAHHPALEEAVIEDAYGRVLSRPGLDAATRETMVVCALAACGLERQLRSHLRGALACGASRAALEAALAIAGRLAGAEAEHAGRALLERESGAP